jgi:hypothetical protein
MTSKDTPSKGAATRPIPSDINSYAVDLLRNRAPLRADIIDPGRLPTVAELHAGMPFYCDSISRDIVAWCETSRHQSDVPEPVLVALQIMRDRQDLDAICQAEGVLFDHGWPTDRLLIYRAMSGDNSARSELADAIRPDLHQAQTNFVHLIRYAVAIGIRAGASCMDGALEIGLEELHVLNIGVAAWSKAVDWHAGSDAAPADDAALDAEFLQAVAEDRAEIFRLPIRAPGVEVVPKLDDAGSSARRDIVKGWHGLHGVPMPCVQRGDIAAQTQAIVDRWPHAEEIVHLIMGDLSTTETVRFRNTMLVGPPGSGKSSLARFLMEASGLTTELIPLAGVHDASAMGTSAQWGTARENAVLQLIRRAKSATVGIVWDEPEKAGTGTQNGSVLDALLPLLEPDSARRYRDLALEVEVDLSMVSHFACANSLEGLPPALRDRFRILRMPEPTWQHIGALSRTIIADLAKARNLDPRWYPGLADDELELIKRAWPGGSLRQLTRIVRTVVDIREHQMGRA